MASALPLAPPKHARRVLGIGAAVGSAFCLPPGFSGTRSLSATSTKMTFDKIVCTRISPHGDPIFEQKGALDGYLADTAMARGTMKIVFDVSFLLWDLSSAFY